MTITLKVYVLEVALKDVLEIQVIFLLSLTESFEVPAGKSICQINVKFSSGNYVLFLNCVLEITIQCGCHALLLYINRPSHLSNQNHIKF